jgi:hypothetical protein
MTVGAEFALSGLDPELLQNSGLAGIHSGLIRTNFELGQKPPRCGVIQSGSDPDFRTRNPDGPETIPGHSEPNSEGLWTPLESVRNGPDYSGQNPGITRNSGFNPGSPENC